MVGIAVEGIGMAWVQAILDPPDVGNRRMHGLTLEQVDGFIRRAAFNEQRDAREQVHWTVHIQCLQPRVIHLERGQRLRDQVRIPDRRLVITAPSEVDAEVSFNTPMLGPPQVGEPQGGGNSSPKNDFFVICRKPGHGQ